jgi:outer membrane protein
MLACAVAAVLALPVAHAQNASQWSLKAGAHWLSPKGSNGSLEIPGVGRFETDVDDAVGFTFVVTYQASPHWAVELLGAAPFSHDIDLEGAGTAETKHLPPTLSWIYTWNPDGRWQPYFGAGINTTIFFDESPEDLSLGDAIGPALVGGIDYQLTDRWFLNLDLRWFDIDTEVKVYGLSGDIGTVSIDPFAAGLMIGYRFGQ